MVIDLLEKSQVNIKDLALPTPENRRDLPFDPERDLTEKDWELLKRNLELCSKQDSSEKKQYLPVLAKQATLLFPERIEEIMPWLAETIWEREKQELTDIQSSKLSEEHLSD